MLEYCKSINQPRLFRYFWSNWCRPGFRNFGSHHFAAGPASMQSYQFRALQCDWKVIWRILKKDYGSRFIKPRLDVL
ncbi:hypothetical protein V1527DRAFT_475118, partial [Lipomyces starkeyi]